MTVDRIAAFAADIDASAEALDRLLDTWQPVDLADRPTIVIAGLGSSRFAGLVVADRLRAMGRTAWVDVAAIGAGVRPGAVTPPGTDRVLIAISASGRTREVLDAAEWHRGRTLVVAVTNRETSPLADLADVVVPLHAGDETAGIACRTYRATVAALALLTGVATVEDLRPVVGVLAAQAADPDLAAATDAVVQALDGAPAIDVVAPAPLVGAAEQAALMLRELPRLPAHAGETGEWLHTAVYLAWPGHRLLRLPGSPADDEVEATVLRRGGALVDLPMPDLAGPAAHGGPIERAMIASLAAERIALGLWQRTSALESSEG